MASGRTTLAKRVLFVGWLVFPTMIRGAGRCALPWSARHPNLLGISDLSGVKDFVQGGRDTGLGLASCGAGIAREDRRGQATDD